MTFTTNKNVATKWLSKTLLYFPTKTGVRMPSTSQKEALEGS